MALFGSGWNDRSDDDVSNILEINRLNKLLKEAEAKLKEKDIIIETLRKLNKI